MRTPLRLAPLALLAMSGISSAPGVRPATGLPSFPFIDAHVHIYTPSPAFYDFIERSNIRLLNLAVIDRHDPIFESARGQHAREADVFRKSHGRVAWASTFDASGFESGDFPARTMAALEETFAAGAIGVKMWKTIGLEIKSRKGEYVMPDNPAFRPILNGLEKRGKTLVAHFAEPITSWLPLARQKPSHALYYGAHPVWHMYLHPGVPSKEMILAARDRMLAAHPKLRVVGCHLGSMEEDVDDVARRLDRYPNFAVDTAARIPELMAQPREKVRAFLIKHQDRILYGTDVVWSARSNEREVMSELRDTYARDWKYLATSEMMEFKLDHLKFQGLGLPMSVLRKIYYTNARRWVPGLVR